MVSKGVIHVTAKCRACKWESGDYINGQRKAREHSRKYGHKIDVEVGIWHVYGE